jgi:hypothetical protein
MKYLILLGTLACASIAFAKPSLKGCVNVDEIEPTCLIAANTVDKNYDGTLTVLWPRIKVAGGLVFLANASETEDRDFDKLCVAFGGRRAISYTSVPSANLWDLPVSALLDRNGRVVKTANFLSWIQELYCE